MNRTDTEFLQRPGDRIRECRTARNLIRAQPAELCDRHGTFIGSVEHGERNVAILNLHKTTPAELLADPGTPTVES